jgi:ASCH domain-containing protein
VEFSRELREDVISGAITLSFRLWGRARVKVGGRYPVGPAHIEIDSVELVPFGTVTPEEVRRCGEADLESLRRRTAHAGPVTGDTLVYRVEFHLTGQAGRGQASARSV